MAVKRNSSESPRGNYRMSAREIKFVAYYIEHGDLAAAVKEAGYSTTAPKAYGLSLINKAKIQAELRRQLSEFQAEHIASTTEILSFYTDAMRGKIKDQFGLDATLADRMKAADALAKRQIDMKALADKAEAAEIHITLNWGDSDGKEKSD